jgi:hypothetical protein
MRPAAGARMVLAAMLVISAIVLRWAKRQEWW